MNSSAKRPEWLAGSRGTFVGPSQEVRTATEGVLVRKRHQVVVLDFEYNGNTHPVAVKYFGRQQGWKDRYDFKRGSKAARSFHAPSSNTRCRHATAAGLSGALGRPALGKLYLSDYLAVAEL